MRSLKRMPNRSWLGGVCAGFSYWLGFPTWILRILVLIFAGKIFWVYFLLWLLMPEWDETPKDYEKITGDN